MAQLEAETESWEQYLVPSPHGVYDHMGTNARYTTERFLGRIDEVTMY